MEQCGMKFVLYAVLHEKSIEVDGFIPTLFPLSVSFYHDPHGFCHPC